MGFDTKDCEHDAQTGREYPWTIRTGLQPSNWATKTRIGSAHRNQKSDGDALPHLLSNHRSETATTPFADDALPFTGSFRAPWTYRRPRASSRRQAHAVPDPACRDGAEQTRRNHVHGSERGSAADPGDGHGGTIVDSEPATPRISYGREYVLRDHELAHLRAMEI